MCTVGSDSATSKDKHGENSSNKSKLIFMTHTLADEQPQVVFPFPTFFSYVFLAGDRSGISVMFPSRTVSLQHEGGLPILYAKLG